MAYDLYLSYSGRATYLLCPQKYWFSYVQKDEKLERDPRNTLFGTSIGKVFEWFYVKDLWAQPDPEAAALALAEAAMQWTFAHEKWDPQTDPFLVQKIRSDLQDLIPSTVGVIRDHKLVSPATRAEFNLQLDYYHPKHGMTLRIGGKADYLHVFQTGNWIVDGKSSAHRDKYVDVEQVIWYGVQHYLKFHQAPARLGFLYFRFPKDPIQWVDYDENSIRDSLDQTFEVAKKISLKMFDATPSLECKRCDWKPRCQKGRDFLADRSLDRPGNRLGETFLDLDLA